MTQLIFDVGSNATKASWVDTNNIFIQDWRISTKLGKHILPDGSISIEAIQNNIQAIQDIIHEVSIKVGYEVPHQCIGTEALRKAQNIAQIQAMFETANLELKILSPQDEAYYERIGIAHSPALANLPKGSLLILDSGGSSTECSIILSDGTVPYAQSFTFGQHKILDILNSPKDNIFPPNDICLEMIDALRIQLKIYPIQYIIAAGSSVISYVMESLDLSYPSEAEGQQAIPHIPVQTSAARVGQYLIHHLIQLTDAPIYVSTYGIRHGWIFSKHPEKSAFTFEKNQ